MPGEQETPSDTGKHLAGTGLYFIGFEFHPFTTGYVTLSEVLKLPDLHLYNETRDSLLAL